MQGWKAGTKGDWKSDGVADAKKTPVSFVGEREGGGRERWRETANNVFALAAWLAAYINSKLLSPE